ncbi:MAG: MmcQ/YjbR family DNA-binding protein [Ferruginibacter sp.]
MHTESIRAFALSLSGVTEHFPFDEVTLVFKVNGKMFLLLPLDETDLSINVKCDPEKAIELREEFPDTVLPGFHMNKKHWNTVKINGRVSWSRIEEMILHSYELVRK